MLWGIKTSGPLLGMEASYFVDTILTGKMLKDSRAATVKKAINIKELKTIHVARCRSTCEAELTMYKTLAFARNTKPSCSHNSISNASNT